MDLENYFNDVIASLKEGLEQNAIRAEFLNKKAEESTAPLVKMSYLAEATGLLQANINIQECFKRNGLIDL